MSNDFTVRPFAFMRLTHEAVRAGVAQAVELATVLTTDRTAETLDALESVYGQTRRGIEIHALLEERAFFPLLDSRFDGVCTREGLAQEHADDERRHAAIQRGLATMRQTPTDDNAASVHRQIADWARETEHHLKHEEDVMMPLTMQVAQTEQGRARAVRDIMDVAWDAVVDELSPWVAHSLETNRPFGQLRMFIGAMMVTHQASERARVAAPLRRALSATTVHRLESIDALVAAG